MLRPDFTFIVLTFLVCSLSGVYSTGLDSDVHLVAQKAKLKVKIVDVDVLTEEVLGGVPMNMTLEPKAAIKGLCPKGCSK
jgi:hypothetical protein